MAGETITTRALCLKIHPWSRTSHVVTWLTPGAGPVTTLVKGACRPKSAFLGQYDLYYTCELVYYARAAGDLHAIRACAPLDLRETIRGDWRRTAFAGYAAYLIGEHAPHGSEAAAWFDLLERTLDAPPDLIGFEMRFLALAGLKPDLAHWEPGAEWMPFSLEEGRLGGAGRSVRLLRSVRDTLRTAAHGGAVPADLATIRFLGLFLLYHVDVPADIRRNTVAALMTPAAERPTGGER